MSAIPNLPDSAKEGLQGTNADAALRQQLETRALQGQELRNGVDGPNGHTATKPAWQMHDTPVENQRRMRVIVIGAGYSGIYMGIRIPEKLRNTELVIYEKNAGVGGTWYENRYVGVACDIPSHSYQYSFHPKPDWSSLYAPGGEIRDYLQSMATIYGADRFIKLQHTVTSCAWDQERGKWIVEVGKPDGSSFKDEADFVVSARGNLNNMNWPNIAGFSSFQGDVMHSAAWREDYDFTSKRIGLIGSGSSAIQILPHMQKVPGAKVSAFIRNRTWISPPFAQTTQDRYGLTGSEFSQEQIQKFKEDPVSWQSFRQDIELDGNSIHAVMLRGSEMQKGAQMAFEQGMKERLKKKPEYFEWLKPGFSPGCRRLTPGPGFLEALVEDNVEYVRSPISNMDETGIVTEDGKHHDLDVLVCATGFNASTAPPFPVQGVRGEMLKDHWAERATNYLSLATDGFPNYMMMLGPNAAIGEGSLTMMIETTGDYIVKAIRKLQKENIKSIVVKEERVRDFLEYADVYFKGTVFSEDCRSWYKRTPYGTNGSIVSGLWPGSSLHFIEALRSPRWEDYVYTYHDEPNGARINQMGWLGNGWGTKQLEEKPQLEAMSFYVTPLFQEREIGLPVGGRPEEKEQYSLRPWSH